MMEIDAAFVIYLSAKLS